MVVKSAAELYLSLQGIVELNTAITCYLVLGFDELQCSRTNSIHMDCECGERET